LRMFFKRNEVDAMLNGFAVDRSKSTLICEICRLKDGYDIVKARTVTKSVAASC